jgi:xanthine phosphoribosyltransferase
MHTKKYITDSEVKSMVHHFIRSMNDEHWRPDYIVGLTRGGLVPAVMLSQYMNVPMHALGVSLRDSEQGPESNLWMAEDAFGYSGPTTDGDSPRSTRGKNILIVDDINDSGATLNWIKEDWQSGCLPSDPRWANIWHDNVRFAVLVNNAGSEFRDPDYVGRFIDKRDDDSWIVFPWENWWA